MSISVRFESPISPPQPGVIVPPKEGRLQIEDIPIGWVNYRHQIDRKDLAQYVHSQVTDAVTGKTGQIFLEKKSLLPLGICPLTWLSFSKQRPEQLPEYLIQTWEIHLLLREAGKFIAPYLARRNLSFIPEEQIPLVTKFISNTLAYQAPPLRVSKKGTPLPVGFSIFDYPEYNVILDIKKSDIGKGSFCKVKAAWRLNTLELVTKKKLYCNNNWHIPTLELKALDLYCNQIGIISYICANWINGSWIVILPHFDISLSGLLGRANPFSLKERLCIAGQLLKGLSNISKHGVHGDIKLANVLLRRNPKWGIEAVITDFGAWRPFGEEIKEITTVVFRPPEYYIDRSAAPKPDPMSVSEAVSVFDAMSVSDAMSMSDPMSVSDEMSESAATPKLDTIPPKPDLPLRPDMWGLGIVLRALFDWYLEPRFTTNPSDEEMKAWAASLERGWIRRSDPGAEPVPPFILELIDAMVDPNPSKRPSPEQAFDLFWKGLCESGEFSPLTLTPPFSLLAPAAPPPPAPDEKEPLATPTKSTGSPRISGSS